VLRDCHCIVGSRKRGNHGCERCNTKDGNERLDICTKTYSRAEYGVKEGGLPTLSVETSNQLPPRTLMTRLGRAALRGSSLSRRCPPASFRDKNIYVAWELEYRGYKCIDSVPQKTSVDKTWVCIGS
jgi:hypothetical protein